MFPSGPQAVTMSCLLTIWKERYVIPDWNAAEGGKDFTLGDIKRQEPSFFFSSFAAFPQSRNQTS